MFIRWFNGYEQQQRYYIKSVEVKGEGDTVDYVALIVQRNHPLFKDVIANFEEEIAMFGELKKKVYTIRPPYSLRLSSNP